MSVLIVRSQVKEESVADVDAAVERLFAAIRRAQPEGIRYAPLRLPDGVTYVALLQLDDGMENPGRAPGAPGASGGAQGLARRVAELRAGDGGRLVRVLRLTGRVTRRRAVFAPPRPSTRGGSRRRSHGGVVAIVNCRPGCPFRWRRFVYDATAVDDREPARRATGSSVARATPSRQKRAPRNDARTRSQGTRRNGLDVASSAPPHAWCPTGAGVASSGGASAQPVVAGDLDAVDSSVQDGPPRGSSASA